MDSSLQVLPIATIVAIALFLAREVLEARRRGRERQRKLAAAKRLLAFETERNAFAARRLFDVLRDVHEYYREDDYDRYRAVNHFDGHVAYQRLAKESDAIESGMPIPPVHTRELDRWLPLIAEIEEKFYADVLEFNSQLFELTHLRSSLIRYLLHEESDGEMWFEGFCDYALEHESSLSEAFTRFYFACTGSKTIPQNIR